MPVPDLPTLPTSLDASFPVLLLPVSVQVKFVHDNDSVNPYELRVRFYPDQISISTHEGGLTLQEQEAGQQYWRQGRERSITQPHKIEYWRALVSRYGAPRAQWIVQQTTPTNQSGPITFPSPALAPDNERWTRPAETRGLPDRFSVLLYTQASTLSEVADGPVRDQLYTFPNRAYDAATVPNPTTEFLQLVKVIQGAPISSQPLPVGLDPRPATQVISDQDIVTDSIGGVDAGNEWTVDFDKAVAQGMAVAIGLTPAEYELGFKRLVVLGVRDASASDGQQVLETLLTDHYYTNGLQIVPQGTPTNNTEDVASGYSSGERSDADASFALLKQDPAADTTTPWASRPDHQQLTGALGVNSTTLPPLASGFDTSSAMGMNRALWPATYGYFLEEMLRPLLSADALAWTRTFFEDYVLARGAVPTFRVGKQPYGVLPTTRFSVWEVPAGTEPEHGYAAQLQRVLSQLDVTWTERLNPQSGLYPKVLGTGTTVAGFPNSMPEASNWLTTLGLNATSTEYYQRYLIGPALTEALQAQASALNTTKIWPDSERSVGRFEAANNPLYKDFTRLLDPSGTLGLPVTTPPIFERTFQSTFTKLADAFADEPAARRGEGVLLDDQPLSETRTLSSFQGVSTDYEGWNYVTWLAKASFDEIRREDFSTMVVDNDLFKAPNALFYHLLRQAVLLEYWAAAKAHHEAAGTPLPAEAVADRELFNVLTDADKPRWAWLYEKVANEPLYKRVRVPSSALTAYLKGVEELAGLPTAQLERLLAEHLDLGNYRLDAWRLAPVLERLADVREQAATTQGSHLGAFGWLEDLIPSTQLEQKRTVVRNDLDNLGYIHAPSLTHGTAAALLRQGYKSRQLSADATDPIAKRMAVDISSQRVRAAMALLEGLRAGQSLGMLLGQAFERAMQLYTLPDGYPSLRQYIPAFRTAFPLLNEHALVSGQQAPQGSPPEQTSRQVLDGAALLRAAGLGYPYGVDGLADLSPASVAFLKDQVKILIDQLDALGDIAVSEGIYQAARGNVDRANAILESVAKGQFAVNPEMVHPPQRSFTFTQRVLVQLPSGTATAWPSELTPRAAAAPRLNAWLAQFFSDPYDVSFSVGQWVDGEWQAQHQLSLYDAGLQPVDLLYLLDEGSLQPGSTFDRLLLTGLTIVVDSADRINYAEQGLQALRQLLPLLARLRRLLGSARPARPHDLQAPGRLSDLDEESGIDATDLSLRIGNSQQALQQIATDLADSRLSDAQHRAALRDAALFGLSEASAALAPEANAATNVAAVLQAIQARLTAIPATVATVQSSLEVAAVLFGPAFHPDVEFNLNSEAQRAYDAATTPAATTALLSAYAGQPALQEWLHGVAAVRESLNHLDKVFLIQGLLDPEGPSPLPLQPAQLSPTTTPGGDYWLGLTWPATYMPPAGVLSLVQWLPEDYTAAAGLHSALWLDEWVETLPEVQHKHGSETVLEPTQTTALTFHYDQPNTEAPQSLLLVVSPRASTAAWTADDLVGAINETLDLAKKRTVEPDALALTHLAPVLPAVVAPVARQAVTFTLDFGRMNGSARFGG